MVIWSTLESFTYVGILYITKRGKIARRLCRIFLHAAVARMLPKSCRQRVVLGDTGTFFARKNNMNASRGNSDCCEWFSPRLTQVIYLRKTHWKGITRWNVSICCSLSIRRSGRHSACKDYADNFAGENSARPRWIHAVYSLRLGVKDRDGKRTDVSSPGLGN